MRDWNLLVSRILDFAHEHWLKALSAALPIVATALWGFFRAWRSWRSRHDMDVIHISQNSIRHRPTGPENAEEPWLILDVIYENPLPEVVTHPMPRRLIQRAAARTTQEQPFLRFNADDRWYVLNIMRLAIAETCAVGTVAKLSKRAQVDEIECVFALTYERYPAMRQGKLRVMLIEKSLLTDQTALSLASIRFESPSHSDRITTLRKMQADYRSAQPEFCMDVRLNVLV